MAPPAIITVDDEPEVLRAVERDLRRKYGKEYRVLLKTVEARYPSVERAIRDSDLGERLQAYDHEGGVRRGAFAGRHRA